MTGYKKGDIVLANFNPQRQKEEVGKIRPAVVVSDDVLNDILDLITVVPLTTNLIDDALPLRVRILKREKLDSDSDAMIENIRSISKKRVLEKISTLTSQEKILIDKGLISLLKIDCQEI